MNLLIFNQWLYIQLLCRKKLEQQVGMQVQARYLLSHFWLLGAIVREERDNAWYRTEILWAIDTNVCFEESWRQM